MDYRCGHLLYIFLTPCDTPNAGVLCSTRRCSQEEEDVCRFSQVCSRCASECDSELEVDVTVADPDRLPACEVVPEGAQTTTRGQRVPRRGRPALTGYLLCLRLCLTTIVVANPLKLGTVV